MDFINRYRANLFNISQHSFEESALDLFNFQYFNNFIYKSYVDHLGIKPEKVDTLDKIPFLPIEFFKYHKIMSGNWEEKIVFESSGTTGLIKSHHYLDDPYFYLNNATNIFERIYSQLSNYTFLALLPSYLENNNSSLIYMIDHFMKESGSRGGFLINDYETLNKKLNDLKNKGEKIIIIGVTYALLDFAEKFCFKLPDVIIMETGGMKGKREEITREEVHDILKNKFSVKTIHSEYGMTELLSQAYSQGDGVFKGPPWFKVITRDLNDPFDLVVRKKAGGINIIDLANVHSCAFIETKDIGVAGEDETFKVLGRVDNSDIRGCNLLMQ